MNNFIDPDFAALYDSVELDASGRVIDFLNPEIKRHDTPEERVRQYFARLLVGEYGYPKAIIVAEAPINIGSRTTAADLAIYDSVNSAHKRDQGRITLLVETKQPRKQEGKSQLESLVCASSAQGGVWSNGTDPLACYRRVDTPVPHLREWTGFPQYGESWNVIGFHTKDSLRVPHDLKRVFQRCHNAIYAIGQTSEDVAMDMVRIILAKYRDERNEGNQCGFRCTPDEFDTSSGRRRVSERIHLLFKQVVDEYTDVFPEGDKITMESDGIAIAVKELQMFKFVADDDTEQVYDIIGTAFEVYVAKHLKGEKGQYFTNRLVIEMVVNMLHPTEKDFVLDPACGSGGFLIASFRYVRSRILKSNRSASAKSKEVGKFSERVYGFDISQKLIRVAKTNMILNGDGHGGMVKANSLANLSGQLPQSFDLHKDTGRTRPTLILTNPPFGASHEDRIKDRSILSQYSLGRVWEIRGDDNVLPGPTDKINTGEGVPPEILFLERCITLLAPDGRLAIVIARGVLDNREAHPARSYLLTHCYLEAVINCHPNTFAPFNGTKASILILRKKREAGIKRNEDYPVFMAVSQRVGQDSQGRELHRKDSNDRPIVIDGRLVLDHDVADLVAAWAETREGKKSKYHAAWTTPLKKILAEPELRLNPSRYAPKAEKALASVLELSDHPQWRVERLGDFADVFNGPRFKRPFAEPGSIVGVHGIVRQYTPKAFFEERGESAKLLDPSKANRAQERALEVLRLRRDMILIVDSGTKGKLLGRVGMTTSFHEGSIGNNNLIRVVIKDSAHRDYVYQFLRSELGQELLVRNVYGTNQDHIEPDDVKDIPIPLPRDKSILDSLTASVRQAIKLREDAIAHDKRATADLERLLSEGLG